jgi:hypothetical protein
MTNCNRLHRGFASSVASSHLVYRIFKLCWCQYAHSAFLRSSLDLDMASARIFNWQYGILLSLFQLFRGKKHNVLRKRIDSCDYDLDQLLLGTILFTLLFFLLPTVVVFYLTFACSRMAIISLKAALDTLLACLNHFPLFALMLRIKDSQRLPGVSPHSFIRHFVLTSQVAFVSNFEIPSNWLIHIPTHLSPLQPPTST